MRNTWTLTKMRMALALRNRAFLFFSLIMPLAFLFLYATVFGRGGPQAISYMLASVLALTVMGSFWGLSMQLVMFREQGVLRRFRLAPLGAGDLLASSVISNYLLTLPTIALEFLISRWVFGMESWGNLAGVLVLVSLGAATFAALGLIVASVTNTMQETQVINNALWFVFLFLSGATIPLPILPGWIQRVSLYLPATYLVTGLQKALLRDAGVASLGAEMAGLGGGFSIAFLISWHLFRWEPEERLPGRAKLWAASAVIPFLLLGLWESARGERRAEARSVFEGLERRAPR